ncbi:retrovirus-related pol polyprotein from transposon TNT 1-94 [Tanacetum coccineum]|uniref:Retrovirus-related pol polyprotein from transposon TNT 1-94 n=1 Tax=Tanacetum coccineum TaxID=301880 RepID=A0ABQ4WD18_9ASTR
MPKGPLQLVDEFVDEGVPEKEPVYGDEEANLQRALELRLKDQGERTQGPARPVVFREPDSGRFQPLPEVQVKGKEKVIEEQVAHDLLTLQTPKRKSLTEQFIFHRRTPMPIEPSGIADSPSLDADLAPIYSETESDEEVSGINAGDQDEGQAGPNPGIQDEGQARLNPGVQDEGQAGSNPSDAAESQPQSSHVVHARPNLEHMDLEATDASTQQNTKQMDEDSTGTLSSLQNLDNELSFTNQFLEEKPQEDKPEKTNNELDVLSMVTVPIHQDTSSVPPMATPVIDLTVSHLISTTVHAPLPTSTTKTTSIITTTYLPPPPPQPQQSSSDPILLQHIGELEQHIADLIQRNLALEESDLPAVDMKEVLQQRMFEDKSYLAHEDHKNLFEALEKSLEHDHSNKLLSDLEEARRKKRKKRASPRTLFGSPPSQPPPPPPPTGESGAPGSAQQQGSEAPSSSKTAASTPQSMAWTTSDTRYESTGVSTAHESSPTDSLMNEDSIPEEHVQLSNDEDTRNDCLPNVDMRKGWWKPLPEEERPATPEPA